MMTTTNLYRWMTALALAALLPTAGAVDPEADAAAAVDLGAAAVGDVVGEGVAVVDGVCAFPPLVYSMSFAGTVTLEVDGACRVVVVDVQPGGVESAASSCTHHPTYQQAAIRIYANSVGRYVGEVAATLGWDWGCGGAHHIFGDGYCTNSGYARVWVSGCSRWSASGQAAAQTYQGSFSGCVENGYGGCNSIGFSMSAKATGSSTGKGGCEFSYGGTAPAGYYEKYCSITSSTRPPAKASFKANGSW